MDKIAEDLIFSIFLYCSKTSDVASLLLLNRHWLGVARYEALWRMRFAFNLNDRIRHEEEKLADNPKALQTSRNKGHIRKLKSLSKTHIDEAEKLYKREKICCEQSNHHDVVVDDGDSNNNDGNDDFKHVDFYTGFRFYTIFKKEVEGLQIGKMTEKIEGLMSCSFEKTYYPVSDSNILTEENPMKKKWNDFIEFVDTNLKPNSNSVITDQYYMLQKNSTCQFAIRFESDLFSMVKKLRKYFNKTKKPVEEFYQDFRNAVANIMEPIKILTDTEKYRYPIEAHKCLLLVVDFMNYDLACILLDTIKRDLKKPEEERQYRDVFEKNGEAINFVTKLVETMQRRSYPVANIMDILSRLIEIFPSLIPTLKKKNNNYYKFKCDEDFLASSILCNSCFSCHNFSVEFFEKAIRDWEYPPNFVAQLLNNYKCFCDVPDYAYSLRRDTINTKKCIHLIEFYEEVSGVKCDDESAFLCATYTSNVELCKYFTDTRGLSLENKKPSYMARLPYSFLDHGYIKSDAFIDMIEFMVDRLKQFFIYDYTDAPIVYDPLQRFLHSIVFNSELDEEKALRVLRKMLDKKPDITRQISGESVLDVINLYESPIMLKVAEIVKQYQKKWERELL